MEIEPELENVLEPGEAVLWSARPDPWYYARPTFMIYIVGVPWTIFTFGWLFAVTDGFKMPGKVVYPYPFWTPWVAISAGLILFLAGLWMLSAPFWIWRRGKKTIYAITNQRALILEIGLPTKTQILPLTDKVSFRIRGSEEKIGDLDVVCETNKGLLFQAVTEPAKVVESLSNSR